MTPNARQVRYSRRFLGTLHEIQEYVGRENDRRGRQFVYAVYDFMITVIEPNPLAFPQDATKLAPSHEFRRAVFLKNYVLFYRVTTEFLDYLLIQHTSRYPGSLSLE